MDLKTFSNISSGILAHSFSIAALKLISAMFLVYRCKLFSFRKSHKEKPTGVNSGDVDGHSLAPLVSIHLLWIFLSRLVFTSL